MVNSKPHIIAARCAYLMLMYGKPLETYRQKDNLESKSLKSVTSINFNDFSTLYTTIPHSKLKSRLKDLITRSFLGKNGKQCYQYLVINDKMNFTYFIKDHSDCTKKYTEDDIINMFNFLIDNIFVKFGGQVFQQSVGIPMGTNCAPLLANLF